MKFPKEIYVRIEKDGGEMLMVASESPEGEDGEAVGVYRLQEVKKLHITSELK